MLEAQNIGEGTTLAVQGFFFWFTRQGGKKLFLNFKKGKLKNKFVFGLNFEVDVVKIQRIFESEEFRRKGMVISMKCPSCGYPESKVIDSRPTDNFSIRRRRECISCRKRFTTYEIIDAVPLTVLKKDGSEELFDRNKILAGLLKSCYKRPVSREQMNELVSDVEAELMNSLRAQVSTNEIGVMVMDRLKKVDEVSYVRFASVYREFKDAETFMKELQDLQRKN